MLLLQCIKLTGQTFLEEKEQETLRAMFCNGFRERGSFPFRRVMPGSEALVNVLRCSNVGLESTMSIDTCCADDPVDAAYNPRLYVV